MMVRESYGNDRRAPHHDDERYADEHVKSPEVPHVAQRDRKLKAGGKPSHTPSGKKPLPSKTTSSNDARGLNSEDLCPTHTSRPELRDIGTENSTNYDACSKLDDESSSQSKDSYLDQRRSHCQAPPATSSVHQHAVLIVNALVLIGALIMSPSAARNGDKFVPLVPIVGVMIYMGIISGYIPSPLYERHERWPKEYALFQLTLLLMTASRLTSKSSEDHHEEISPDASNGDSDSYDYDMEEMAEFTHWLGSNLHNFFYNGTYNIFAKKIADESTWFLATIFLSYMARRVDLLNKIDESKGLPMSMIVLRNIVLSVGVSFWFIYENLYDPESDHYKFCTREYDTVPGLIAPDYPLSDLASDFAAAWKVFHLSDLWLVRLSHAILYPTVLLMLTRRRLSLFFIWLWFTEIDILHMLADMVHYASGPELAEERLEFQGGAKDCYVNVYLVQGYLAYPLNFLYLSTSLGDSQSE